MQKEKRVVITGLGVVAPNGHGLVEFQEALKLGRSRYQYCPELEAANFRCQVGGIPQGMSDKYSQYLSEEDLLAMNEAIIYGAIAAAIDAWRDAGLAVTERNASAPDSDKRLRSWLRAKRHGYYRWSTCS